MIRNFLRRKLKDIRYNYGQSAVDYFIKFHVCEFCKEDRLLVLNIHHVHGKKVNVFKTLCHNCHMINHNPKSCHETFASCLHHDKTKENLFIEKENKILSLLNEGIPIRLIRSLAKTSTKVIHKVLKENNFLTKPRSGYKKIVEE